MDGGHRVSFTTERLKVANLLKARHLRKISDWRSEFGEFVSSLREGSLQGHPKCEQGGADSNSPNSPLACK